jgi:hypothetical protein
VKIVVGIDNGDGAGTAKDGILQVGEIDQTSYLCGIGPKRAFITSTATQGNMGGLAGADARCQSLADAAKLPGAYKAWLSDAQASPLTRFTHSALPYIRVDGTQIAADWASLISGALTGIGMEENGVSLPTISIWTGTNDDGTGAANCNGWTSSDPSYTGVYGGSNYSSEWSNTGVFNCDFGTNMYCFEQ